MNVDEILGKKVFGDFQEAAFVWASNSEFPWKKNFPLSVQASELAAIKLFKFFQYKPPQISGSQWIQKNIEYFDRVCLSFPTF